MRAQPLLFFAVLGLVIAGPPRAAAQSPVAHPGEYAPADISYGARLYDAQCTTCHGANGDGVGGVDLRSGRFRNAVTDQDLVRVVTNGIPGTGMLGFKFDPSELAGLVAYLRNMSSFDRGSVKAGDAGRGRAAATSGRGRGLWPDRRRNRRAGPLWGRLFNGVLRELATCRPR